MTKSGMTDNKAVWSQIDFNSKIIINSDSTRCQQRAGMVWTPCSRMAIDMVSEQCVSNGNRMLLSHYTILFESINKKTTMNHKLEYFVF